MKGLLNVSFQGADVRKLSAIADAEDPKQGILDALGDLSGIDRIFFNNLLVATYIRSRKIGTAGVLIAPDSRADNDQHQSKVGLVIMKGPNAFVSDERNDFGDQNAEVGDWIAYRIGDGWPIVINGVHCRVLEDSLVRFKLTDPGVLF
jgi:hypothetical protein